MWWSNGERKEFHVYIVSNNSMTLYTGVTNDLKVRSRAHKSGEGSQFTSRYHIDRLAYFESFGLIVEAIAREKEIKTWSRKKKIALIQRMNPQWRDLSEDL